MDNSHARQVGPVRFEPDRNLITHGLLGAHLEPRHSTVLAMLVDRRSDPKPIVREFDCKIALKRQGQRGGSPMKNIVSDLRKKFESVGFYGKGKMFFKRASCRAYYLELCEEEDENNRPARDAMPIEPAPIKDRNSDSISGRPAQSLGELKEGGAKKSETL